MKSFMSAIAISALSIMLVFAFGVTAQADSFMDKVMERSKAAGQEEVISDPDAQIMDPDEEFREIGREMAREKAEEKVQEKTEERIQERIQEKAESEWE